ncbi:MAG: hypothetical protein M0R32_11125 [Candidatus Cloacimonetes bacterium]|jgi:predicted RNA-binding Zn-ribbon protein involved in translation (DUF1610 family)|nr:hypothetical protein [Candidatus Cloacimonadota bacterium]
MSRISVNITQYPSKGEKSWAYSVSIGEGLHKIGYGHTYAAAEKLARSGVKSAKKYLEKQEQYVSFGCSHCGRCSVAKLPKEASPIPCPNCGEIIE